MMTDRGRMDGAAAFDEMHEPSGEVRPAYAGYNAWLERQQPEWLRRKHLETEGVFRRTGITFNVYGEDAAEERLIPFDMVPRIVSAARTTAIARMWLSNSDLTCSIIACA